MIRAAALLVVCLASVALPVSAKELPESVRRMAERAFLEGRLEDLDTILAGAREPIDVLPLVLRDKWWRTTDPAPEPGTWETDDPLTRARLGFLESWPLLYSADPWPMPERRLDGGGEDPYPILSALIRDRIRRERRGHAGLPQDGPLRALAARLDPRREKRAIWFLDEHSSRMMSVAYRGVPPHPDQVAADREAEALRARNGLWAVLALAAFLLLPTVLAGRLLRERS